MKLSERPLGCPRTVMSLPFASFTANRMQGPRRQQLLWQKCELWGQTHWIRILARWPWGSYLTSLALLNLISEKASLDTFIHRGVMRNKWVYMCNALRTAADPRWVPCKTYDKGHTHSTGHREYARKKMCYHFIVNAIMTKYPWNIPPEHSELIYSMTIAYSLIFFFIRKHKRISDEVVLKKILRKTMQNYFISKVKTKRCYRLCFQNPSATRHNDTDTTLWNPVLKSCVYGLLRFLPISRIKLTIH